MFRCGKCGAAVTVDALNCDACSFVFGSAQSEAKSRPSMVVLTQLVALVLAMFSFPTLILAGASENRAAHREDQGVIAMELIAAIAMFCVVLVIVGVALDAARRAK